MEGTQIDELFIFLIIGLNQWLQLQNITPVVIPDSQMPLITRLSFKYKRIKIKISLWDPLLPILITILFLLGERGGLAGSLDLLCIRVKLL